MLTVTEIETMKKNRRHFIDQAAKIVQKCKDEKCDLDEHAAAKFNRLHDQADKIAKEYAAAERQLASASVGRTLTIEEASPERDVLTYRGWDILIPAGSDDDRRRSASYRGRFTSYLCGVEAIEAGLQRDFDEKGGYAAPPEYSIEVNRALDNTCWVRRLANVLPPTAQPEVRFIRRAAQVDQFTWGTELTTPTADTALKLGGYTLRPQPMVGEIQVERSLFLQPKPNVDRFVKDEITLAIAATEENAFLTGDGIKKPVGVFDPAPAGGVGTDRDVTVALTQAGLMDVKMSLREPYLRSPSLRWAAHRNFLRAVAKLDPASGSSWTVSMEAGEPDRVLNVPVELSEFAPSGTGASNTYTTGDYAAVLGDFAMYDVQDVLGLSIQVDQSLERRRGVVVYIVRRRVDGCPKQGEAFSRLKVA
jgi:HK97 family phage major capsid protein